MPTKNGIERMVVNSEENTNEQRPGILGNGNSLLR